MGEPFYFDILFETHSMSMFLYFTFFLLLNENRIYGLTNGISDQ